MTLQEAKDQVAKRLGFKNWDSAVWYEIDESNNITSKPYSEERASDEAAELYARSKWEEACDQQRKICYRAYMDQPVAQGKDKFETISKEMESILNAIKPEFK